MNVTKLIAEYDQIPENTCGGNLHVILDDGNVDDNSVIFLLQRMQERKRLSRNAYLLTTNGD